MNHPSVLLTPRQREALDAIRDHIQRTGYPPTLREIGARIGVRSTNGVNDHLRALERKGYIRRDDMVSRGITVLGDESTVLAKSQIVEAFLALPVSDQADVLSRIGAFRDERTPMP